jgi:glycosyltransferase involved in cell wall biosynthesis
VTLLQRELLSTLVTLEPLTKTPRILDVDDAIFLERQGRTARRLAQLCDRVICGNTFLADWFSTWNRDTVVVPTAVDSDRYLPVKRARGDAELVMGWIGTHGNIKYLRTVEPALRRVMDAVPGARLRVVSDRPPDLSDLAPGRVDFVRWSERSEVANIQAMDVGLMPLEDSPWARGKCSFKMLQYMSCGLPVVVSPVGMNAEVLRLGECGVAASTETQWVDGLIALLESPELRSRLAAEGRRVVEAAFSVRVVAPQLARCLRAR